ncbi:hypothetical protein ACF064_12770 [Streptomyces sp. NPDC015492]|uniref:hypothetical protein n=1 Tax=unclassified Streptomyces TaxID=2593676 RepID=UPI0036F5FAA3
MDGERGGLLVGESGGAQGPAAQRGDRPDRRAPASRTAALALFLTCVAVAAGAAALAIRAT